MLELIIRHFREDNNEPKMKKVILTKGEKEKLGRSSRYMYSYSLVKGPGKKRNTKRKKNLRKINKENKEKN